MLGELLALLILGPIALFIGIVIVQIVVVGLISVLIELLRG